jgi:serine/threonine protein kinase/predicted negative regulator of RcsB-dependent stress response
MAAEHWERVKDLFHGAIERDRSRRAAFLEEACAGDMALRNEVESLIASHEEAGSFIEPAGCGDTSVEPEPEAPPERQLIGPYKIIREIGRGGMGAVYLAVRADDQYEKEVAIKLVKPGMGTDFLVRRFQNERQILARLTHPNIAMLLDGGATQDGAPYFVMEYVDGRPIAEFCDAHKLPTPERLKLFRMVCSAVHYAHQNLVIHRDIKPGNILVTAEAVPKLLDFGIAKLLNPELSVETGAPTATAMRLMTPEYASPEQIRGEPVTTASDVYSLGVVLYELLTGHRPYRTRGRLPHEIAQAICEEEPDRPSAVISRMDEMIGPDGISRIAITAESVRKAREEQPDRLRRRLSGDLDNIVLKALRKEPQRRYGSVDQLSEDIRLHLAGLPVMARKATFSYRAGKFIKRHKAGVAAVALVGITLTAGIVATTWQARVATAQKARAERRFGDVRKLANSFMFELNDAIATTPGTIRARELLVKKALEYLDSLVRESGDDRSLQRELATAYERVGDIQGNPNLPNLGDMAGALESYRKSLEIRKGLAVSDPSTPSARRDLSWSYLKIGDILAATGDTTNAVASYSQALAIREALAAGNPGNAQAGSELSMTYERIGLALQGTAGALENHRKALAIREALVSVDPTNLPLRRDLAFSYANAGRALEEAADTAGGFDLYSKALVIRQALVASDPTNMRARSELAGAYEAIGNIKGNPYNPNLGDTSSAVESYKKAVEIREALAAADPANAQARRDLSWVYYWIGDVDATTGDTARASEAYRRALAISESLSAADPRSARARGDLTFGYERMGDLFRKLGDTIGALQSHHKALAIRQELAAADPTDATARNVILSSHVKIGDILASSGDAAGALDSYTSALETVEGLCAGDPNNAKYRREKADLYFKIGKLHKGLAPIVIVPTSKRTEHFREARLWFQRSFDAWVDLRNRNMLKASDANRPDEAAREIAKCDRQVAPSNDPATRPGSR